MSDQVIAALWAKIKELEEKINRAARVEVPITAGGGDADTLDGIQASQFLRNDVANQNVKSLLTFLAQDADLEGGHLAFQKGSNSTVIGAATIDLSGSKLRFFDSGGSQIGAYIDLASGGSYGIASRIWYDTLLSGNSFPASPFSNQPFFRKDLGYWCFWNNTYWLTENEYQVSTPHQAGTITTNFPEIAIDQNYRPFFTRAVANLTGNATLDASNYWTFRVFTWSQNNGSSDNLATWYMNPASGFSAGINKYVSVTINRVSTNLPTARISFNIWAGNGSPGPWVVEGSLFYRKVIA